MTTFVQMVITGVALSAVYALVALGFTVIFKSTHTMNFAQGALLVVGGLLVARLEPHVGFWPAAVLAALATGAVALLEGLLLRASRQHDSATLAIMTIGVNIALTAEMSREIGVDVLTLGDPWGSKIVSLGGVTIAQTRLAALARLTQRAQEHKPRLARQAERIAAGFVLGIGALAVLVYLYWHGTAPERAFEVALALLVVSCPCALALAVPAALAAARRRHASARGLSAAASRRSASIHARADRTTTFISMRALPVRNIGTACSRRWAARI